MCANFMTKKEEKIDAETIEQAVSNQNWTIIPDNVLSRVNAGTGKKLIHDLLKEQKNKKLSTILTFGKNNNPEYVFRRVIDAVQRFRLDNEQVPDLTVVAAAFNDITAYRSLRWCIIGRELFTQGYEYFATLPLLDTEILGDEISDFFNDDFGYSVLRATLTAEKDQADEMRSILLPPLFTRGEAELIAAWVNHVGEEQARVAIEPTMIIDVVANYDQKIASILTETGYRPDPVTIFNVRNLNNKDIDLSRHKALIELFNINVKKYGEQLYNLAFSSTEIGSMIDVKVTDLLSINDKCYLNYLEQTHSLDPAKYVSELPDDVSPLIKRWFKNNLSENEYATITI